MAMSKYKRRWIIASSILSGLVLITLALVAAGFRKLEAYEYGLDYSYITGTSLTTAQSTGIYYISFTHKFIKFNRTQQSVQLNGLTSLTSDQIRTRSDVQVNYWLTSFVGADLLNYYINFGEQPEFILRPIFANAVHRSISALTISDLKSFDDLALSQRIAATISAAVSPLAPISVSVAIDAFTSDYENRTASVEVARLKRRSDTLASLYSTLKQLNSSGDFVYRIQQAFIQATNSAANRTAFEVTNLNNVLAMLVTSGPVVTTVGFPKLYQMMLSSNQSYYEDKLMPNYIRYGVV